MISFISCHNKKISWQKNEKELTGLIALKWYFIV